MCDIKHLPQVNCPISFPVKTTTFMFFNLFYKTIGDAANGIDLYRMKFETAFHRNEISSQGYSNRKK